MADDVTITVHVRDLTGPGFQSVSRNLNQLQRQAQQMGGSLRIVGGQLDDVAASAGDAGRSLGGGSGLRGKAIAAAAAVGTTLLPTLGALAPMLTGVAVVGGGAALALDDLKEKAKELKKPFEEWQKVANKAVAPHTEKAVKSLKGAMKDLTPVIELGADTFGRITEKAAKFADSPAFKGALAKNAEMGAVWVEQFAGSIGQFTQAFLDFGTKSQPALDAWQRLLGGLLQNGLPQMFKELEQGISGSSEFLNGFASFLNNGLLPALGKIAGSFTEAFGPLLGELLETAGEGLLGFATAFEGAMTTLEPLARIAADALNGLTDIFRIGLEAAGAFTSAVGGALVESLLSLAGIDTSGIDDMAGGFTKISDWVSANESTIRSAFFAIAGGITSMVIAGVSMLPDLWTAFRTTTELVLTAVDGMVSGLAAAFGDLPVIGETFRNMNSRFDEFARGARTSLDKVGGGIDSFVDEALPRLSRAKVTLNVSEAEQNLNSIKEKLKDPALTEERKATLTADKERAEAVLREARRDLANFDKAKAEASLNADPRDFFGDLGRANRSKLNDKSAQLRANPNSFWGTVRGLTGRVLGTSYINVAYRQVESSLQPRFRAQGGPIRLADGGSPGGRIVGPGTETSDSIPAMLSAGEYVVRASSVRKYGERFMDAVNAGTLKVAGFARGGMSQATKDARSELSRQFGISFFGKHAGYRTDPFERRLGAPASLDSLVVALNETRGLIARAASGRTESRLLSRLTVSGRTLIRYEKNLLKVNSALEKARDKLDDLRQSAARLSDSVKSGVLSGANITRSATAEDSRVTINTLLSHASGNLGNVREFATAIAQLRERGVSGSIIGQIAEAGIEGGGLETAQALLGASSGQIRDLNRMHKDIETAAGVAGSRAADAMYGAGIRAADGLVKGLTRQQDAIEKAMMNIAKSMEKAIKQALGIRSPSKVMEQVGDYTAQGFALGMRKNRSVQSAWASMLNVPQAPAAAASAGGAARGVGERPIVLNVNLGGREFGQIWVDVGRREVSTRGGLTATLGGM
ncbi:hypothetical protein K4749_01390 [Streptomyces sp. TRM72054]|uniref:hypothetical protein n=1 Tax=Streptomyces sp. TRM72054 TaxID=2870562 RepID=UPI001C8CF1E1|nr:hypothetical protein [Streptomyces sp. TRM72054]MBX9392285.1 hypothetical protein [Streptomyces sp. TRM72054]